MEPQDNSKSAGESVPALRRAVRLLDHVSAQPTPPTAADLARALDLPKSTAHGLIGCMVELGLLARSPEGTFRLGPHLMSWASGFLGQFDLVGEFQRVFAQAPALEGYTIMLTVLEGTEVVYLACRNSSAPLGFTFRIGMRLPAPFTATGMAMLSTRSPEEVRALLGGQWPAPMTSRSAGDMETLLAELAATRARGFSLDEGQVRDGMVCIGAPVKDYSGLAVAGLALSLLEQEATPERVADLGARLRRIAADLSGRLGAAGASAGIGG
ncbi:IclR family transcriptional regulator [Azorhizobium sp. AG788]|uniref:IclR family transcriptional regulator n=1 Tax=Azorhizobium sp. AG788 TaxID=2183897 RepID=UPI003139022D